MCLYRWNGYSEELLQESWTRTVVVVPRRNIAGSVGRYQGILWKELDLKNRMCALSRLRVEAYEKYHFYGGRNEPFECPYMNCSETFDQASKFTNYMNSERQPHPNPHSGPKYTFYDH